MYCFLQDIITQTDNYVTSLNIHDKPTDFLVMAGFNDGMARVYDLRTPPLDRWDSEKAISCVFISQKSRNRQWIDCKMNILINNVHILVHVCSFALSL